MAPQNGTSASASTSDGVPAEFVPVDEHGRSAPEAQQERSSNGQASNSSNAASSLQNNPYASRASDFLSNVSTLLLSLHICSPLYACLALLPARLET